jgi:hypothetical protein
MKAPRLPKLFDITDEGSAIADAIRDGRLDEIGWQSLVEGRSSLGWIEVQQRYYE